MEIAHLPKNAALTAAVIFASKYKVKNSHGYRAYMFCFVFALLNDSVGYDYTDCYAQKLIDTYTRRQIKRYIHK